MGFTEKNIERFWNKVQKTRDCWNWIAGKTRGGYGKVKIGRKTLAAHRVSWLLAGKHFIEGQELDHLCNNPSCVNPKHLQQVEHFFNAIRNRNTKLTPADIFSIRKITNSGIFTQKEIGHKFGVGQDQISRILSHKHWALI